MAGLLPSSARISQRIPSPRIAAGIRLRKVLKAQPISEPIPSESSKPELDRIKYPAIANKI